MLPSPSSSPRAILENTTNISRAPVLTNSWCSLLTPPHDKTVKRCAVVESEGRLRKRVKLDFNAKTPASYDQYEDSDSSSDLETGDFALAKARLRKYTPFHGNTRSIMLPVGRSGNQHRSTRAILQSFVSSNKSDIFKCQSNDVDTFLTPLYACSYTHGAKLGKAPLLAVATEQGSVHILNTSQRKDWDVEPPRAVFQPHNNGIFDVKWNMDDTRLATCSGDQSARITCPTTNTTLFTLRGHTSTAKCIAWDPTHSNLLSTGGRDGNICIWDLRMQGSGDSGSPILSPVISILGAHETAKSKGRPRKNIPIPKTVTNLLYPAIGPYGLISSGAFDGVLRYWDLRLLTNTKKSKSKTPAALFNSPIDPTTLHGSRRPRGITALAEGTGPTAGLIFGLGADSRVHTYTLPSLAVQKTGYLHENMQTNSFYVGLALSPCGRWLASGGTGKGGSNFLFDVSNAASPSTAALSKKGVELRGQLGEVGALDWSDNALATCADDGTVRLWRPNIEIYRACIENPEKRWDWSWAVGES